VEVRTKVVWDKVSVVVVGVVGGVVVGVGGVVVVGVVVIVGVVGGVGVGRVVVGRGCSVLIHYCNPCMWHQTSRSWCDTKFHVPTTNQWCDQCIARGTNQLQHVTQHCQ
jgi:hypothetical protein